MATPLQTVKTQFSDKTALVEKLLPILDRRADESANEFKERLMRVSNKKLLRLWAREQRLREEFGSRETLVDRIVDRRLGREDRNLRTKLLGMGTGRLLNLHSAR
ncbi:hypothetical protein KKF91_01485 [Myxococcota bacterium]|nr:hypothetical protein [Myxococcota bacterium]MBU1429209.1 hypothetical protein [Myxococcota bacterium]MBU1898507.1 hypothetical protein [Myxococcota bacterium]